MVKRAEAELRDHLVQLLTAQVRAGFLDREAIWSGVDDLCEESSDPDATRAFGAAELARLWAAQRAVEAGWVGRTDCDRLDAAFEELETTGIVCRQDFTCCGTCGAAEIGMEIEGFERKRGVCARGYTFYHMQDTERAVEGGGVYLNYAAAEPDATLPMAREIVATLTSHGLTPKWNGQTSQRIRVPLEWRRRFVCK